MRTARKFWRSGPLASVIVLLLLVACGQAPSKQNTPLPEAPGEFSLATLAAACYAADSAAVSLTWYESERAESYTVLRNGEAVASLGGEMTAYLDHDGIEPGSSYSYVIQASNTGGSTDSEAQELQIAVDLCNSEDPEAGETPTPAADPPPTPADDLTAVMQCTPAGPTVVLSWSTVEGAEQLLIERDYAELENLAGSATTYTDAGFVPDVEHTYVLRASNATGISLSLPVRITVPFAACGLGSKTVSSRAGFSLAVARDGTVWAWGGEPFDDEENDEYRSVSWLFPGLGPGDGNPLRAGQPVRVPGLTNITAVAAGYGHALALDSSGNVWGWGYWYGGVLGKPDDANPWPQLVQDLPPIIDIAAGAQFSLALAEDGTVWSWGVNKDGQLGRNDELEFDHRPIRIEGLSDVRAVYAGDEHSFAVHTNGTVSAWGNNDDGQLGLGDYDNRYSPELVEGLTEVRMLAATHYASVAISETGTVWMWGYTDWDDPDIGPVSIAESNTPIVIPEVTGAVHIAIADNTVTAVLDDGSAVTWGLNWLSEPVWPPETVPGVADAVLAAAGQGFSFVVDGTGRVQAWGSNQTTGLGWNTPQFSLDFVEAAKFNAAQLSAGEDFALALDTSGTVYSWGLDHSGQLGQGTEIVERSVPTPINGLPAGVTQVSAGREHALAVDGQGAVWAWGSNRHGKLGLGSAGPEGFTSVPMQIEHDEWDAIAITQVAAGNRHSLALDENGDVWAWGGNFNGELGNGTSGVSHGVDEPFKVSLPDSAIHVAAGDRHSVAVLADGSVYSWGSRSDGAMGDSGASGSTGNQTVPIAADLEKNNVVAVAAGHSVTIALHEDGSVSAWGNRNYLARTGLPIVQAAPMPIPDLNDIVHVDVSNTHALAWSETGALYTWGGYNDFGELGDGSYTPSTQPVLVASNASFAAAGVNFTVAVLKDMIYTVGSDRKGQLGVGHLFGSSRPIPITGLPLVATP